MLKRNFINIRNQLIDMSRVSMRYESTTSLLQKLTSSPDKMTKDVATHILENYELADINRTNKIGFFWHQKSLKPQISWGRIRFTHGLNVIYVDANCDPKPDRNSGSWITEKKYDSFWKSNKATTKKEFTDAGFKCTQDHGSDTEKGDKALSFENLNP